MGTLCFMDHRSNELLADRDVRFLTVLAMRASVELQRERMLEAQVRDVREASEQLARVNAELLRASEEKRRFIAAVIHDLRQPIATMGTLLYVLSKETDVEQQEESIRQIESRVRALGGMVDELLEFAQLDAGEHSQRVEEVELEGLLRICVEEMRPEAEVRSVRLTFIAEPGLGAGNTDRGQLARVLRNLVSNGIKFTAGTAGDAPPRVTVRARSCGAHWTLEVEDNGMGMPRSVMSRLVAGPFSGFGTGGLGQRPGYAPVRGLGLAIVKRLCDVMGAEISVRSREGQGTRVRIRFPYARGA